MTRHNNAMRNRNKRQNPYQARLRARRKKEIREIKIRDEIQHQCPNSDGTLASAERGYHSKGGVQTKTWEGTSTIRPITKILGSIACYETPEWGEAVAESFAAPCKQEFEAIDTNDETGDGALPPNKAPSQVH